MTKLSETLESRGYVYQHSAKILSEVTDGEKRTLYLGIDPTADSLHVGHLQNLFLLKYFIDDGHKVFVLVGGGTGMIGDPSGKNEERNLLDTKTIQNNATSIKKQIEVVVGSGGFEMINNIEWLKDIKLLDFLRDTGKYFTVNEMLRKDSVKGRIEGKEKSISFTEFSYQLLQSYDFLHLHNMHGCNLQIGASDQWGNISSGIDFIRRKTGDLVYGFTTPLLVDKKTGKKFGKSEGGTIWLDVEKTSPFNFYQFWFNTGDESVEELLMRMTYIPLSDVANIMEEHRAAPAERIAQRKLAISVTSLAHSKQAAEAAEKVSKTAFGEWEVSDLAPDAQTLMAKEMPTTKVRVGQDLIDILIHTNLATSKNEARGFIEKEAITLNGAKVTDVNRKIRMEDFQNANVALLKRGKKNIAVLTQI
jgi:tyrosyl-tRNA synthetase